MSKNSAKLGKPKPTKKVKHGALVKKAHALMRDIVLLRDKGCVCPPPKKGHSGARQAGHIIPSVKGGSRFSLWNVHEQCAACNGRHTRPSDYHVYQGWFQDKFGHERWDAVRKESENEGLKAYELQELIVQFENMLAMVKSFPAYAPYFTQNEILSGQWQFKYETMMNDMYKAVG